MPRAAALAMIACIPMSGTAVAASTTIAITTTITGTRPVRPVVFA
jgi:hypothetical protein